MLLFEIQISSSCFKGFALEELNQTIIENIKTDSIKTCRPHYMMGITYLKITNIICINVRENHKGNHEWTIQRYSQHRAHKTQNANKPKTQHNTTVL